MPRISVIRADGTGDYTTLQAWASAEGNVDYGAITVARLDGFFDVGAGNLDFISTWPNGARLECFNPDNAFNGTRRMLCGVTGTASQTIRNRGKNIELDGLEVYNAGTGTPYWNTTSGGTFKADNCLFKDFNPSSAAAIMPATLLGDGLTNCVIDSNSRGYSAPIKMNKCTVLTNSTQSISTTSDAKQITDTVTTNKLSGICYRPEVTQTNCASTDGTAFAFPFIVVASEFVNADPAVSGIYYIRRVSTLSSAGIGAYVEQGEVNIPPVITLIGDSFIVLPFGVPYEEPGYTAFDEEDGDITASVIVTGDVNENLAGVYEIYYFVEDSLGLSDEKVRLVEVEPQPNQKPVITLLGDNPLTLSVGTPYVEPGYEAIDPEDGDITAIVTVTGSVDFNTVGVYQLFYDVIDSDLEPADQVIRTVNVIAVSSQLNMTLQNIPDGINNTRIINPLNGGQLVFNGAIEWSNNTASFVTDLPVGTVLHYYAISETESGINIGVTE